MDSGVRDIIGSSGSWSRISEEEFREQVRQFVLSNPPPGGFAEGEPSEDFISGVVEQIRTKLEATPAERKRIYSGRPLNSDK